MRNLQRQQDRQVLPVQGAGLVRGLRRAGLGQIEDMELDREPQIDNDKALIPASDRSLSRRSIEVTRSCIDRGQGATRSLWVNIQPTNPILKAVLAVPAAAVMLSMMILMMLIAGFTLLAVSVILASSGKLRKENNS